ncbi:hypothetical protein [Aeromonas caviae]|nr:hypothetical protein [Aeromonas caviae]
MRTNFIAFPLSLGFQPIGHRFKALGDCLGLFNLHRVGTPIGPLGKFG